MINKIINYFRFWAPERYVRLALGGLAALYAITSEQYGILPLAAWFVVMAVLNISCGPGGCGVSPATNKKSEATPKTEDVTFEEVK